MMKCPFAEKCRFGKSGQNRHGKCEFQHPPPLCEKYLKDLESCKDWIICKDMHPAPYLHISAPKE